MAKFFGLDKIRKVFDIIKFNGGLRSSLYKYYRNDDLRIGTLVGTDKFGNKYYENKEFFYGRNRWVDYSDQVGLEYDGSQVPSEWHRWLHYITDDPPTKVPPVQHRWIVDHVENFSGTTRSYTPYSTTRSKIESWTPPKQ
ncbi:hypothetical protein CHUAL_013362 [Chamberlinius hualienensis]